MFRNRQKAQPNNQADIFFKESRLMFGGIYQETKQPYVLMARNILEGLVDQGMVTAEEAISTLRTPADFSALLLRAEQKYKDQEDQKLHKRMASLERNTDWRAAALISFGTGLVFAIAGPFFSSLLQPTTDELFKRHPVAQPTAPTQPYTTQNIINNNVYNFYPPDSKPAPSQEAKTQENKSVYKVACKNAVIENYNNSLLELLRRGYIVTLEANGKKVSLCYRPSQQNTAQQQTLAR